METFPRQIDRYLLYPPFAHGGMATIHLARQLGLGGIGRVVAVKRLQEAYARDADFVQMFLDEARITTGIEHPNVIKTLDVLATDGELMLVMELVRGSAFSHLLKRSAGRKAGGPLPIVSAIILGTLEGLHAAHEALGPEGEPLHIVHRDVSPHNILVGTDGVARVADFGIAKAMGRSYVTRSGEVKGKLAYMAPEQIRNEPVDRRADVYAAAVVLWEALTGSRLFEGQDGAILHAVLQGEIRAPSRLRADVPPAVDAIVLRGLAREPHERFQTALEMAQELESALPPARPREVGAWVSTLARDAIAKQAVLIQDVESKSKIRGLGPGSRDGFRTPGALQLGPVGALAGALGGSRRLVLGLAIGALAVGGLAAVLVLRSGDAPSVATPTDQASVAEAVPPSAAVRAAETGEAPGAASAPSTTSASLAPTARGSGTATQPPTPPSTKPRPPSATVGAPELPTTATTPGYGYEF